MWLTLQLLFFLAPQSQKNDPSLEYVRSCPYDNQTQLDYMILPYSPLASPLPSSSPLTLWQTLAQMVHTPDPLTRWQVWQ